jgi:hypothetical protein
MNEKSLGSYCKILLPLTATLVLMGCASGTVKTEAWRFDDEAIAAVNKNCVATYPDATGGTLSELWNNKRTILRMSRSCTEAALLLSEQAANRNKVLGN